MITSTARRVAVTAALIGGALFATSPARASNVHWSVGITAPIYPAHVGTVISNGPYYAPPPIYYASPPAPYYHRPAPVVVHRWGAPHHGNWGHRHHDRWNDRRDHWREGRGNDRHDGWHGRAATTVAITILATMDGGAEGVHAMCRFDGPGQGAVLHSSDRIATPDASLASNA